MVSENGAASCNSVFVLYEQATDNINCRTRGG